MLLSASPAHKLPRLLSMREGKEASHQQEDHVLLSQLTDQPAGHDLAAPLCEAGNAVVLQNEEVFAKLAEEASKPQPGEAEKEELIRTASAPSELPDPREMPMLQTSGLEWSGSIHEATLLRFSQDFDQVAREADAAQEGTQATIAFPPREHYRQAASIPAMARLSEDWGRSSTYSDSLETSLGMAAGRAASSTLAGEDSPTPVLSKDSSFTTPVEVPFESPFEAPEFQEEPIARPASLPEVNQEDVVRSAATVPPTHLDSMLSPAATADAASVSAALLRQISREEPTQREVKRKEMSHPVPGADQAERSPAMMGQQELSHTEMSQPKQPLLPSEDGATERGVFISETGPVGKRQPGMKSLSVLERDGIPLLKKAGASACSSPETVPSTMLRQKLAQEAGFRAPQQTGAAPALSLGHAISQRCQTVPSIDLLHALESIRQVAQKPALAPIPAEDPEEEDMMAITSLQQAISSFQPVEELVRSPTRAPSLTDTLIESGSEWIIQSAEIELGRRIGSGSFGEVFRAQWRHTDVAVKRVTNVSESLLGDFQQEVALMARLKHPNVVQFLGACVDYPNLAIVTQFMPRGSLFNLLHRAKVKLDERQKLWMALDCAKGMHYLHSCRPPIVHGDVSSKNMLVDRDFSIRVADFGMSRQRRKAMLSAKGESQGTAEWTAPEILRGLPYTESCDVFSFGVVLYELMTQQVPWADLSTIQVLGAVGWGNASLTIPDHVNPPIRRLMSDCMQRDPQKRPTFEEIIVRLRNIRHKVATESSPSSSLHAEHPVVQQQPPTEDALSAEKRQRAASIESRRTA